MFSGGWITDEDVEGLGWEEENCLTRNAYSTWTWHSYTTLLENYAEEYNCPGENLSNYPMRYRVRELIRQHSSSIEIVLSGLPSVLQEVTFEGHGWIGDSIGDAIQWEWDLDYDDTVFDIDATGSSVTHLFDETGSHTIALRASAPGALPIIVTKEIYISQIPIEVGYPEGFESLKRDFSTPYSDLVSEYEWNFGDGSPTESGREESHTYETTGYYSITLTVTLNDGSTLTGGEKIFVGPGTRYIQGHTITGAETWLTGGTYVILGNIYVSRGVLLSQWNQEQL